MNLIRMAAAVLLLPTLMANSTAPVAVSKKIIPPAKTTVPAFSANTDCYATWNLIETGLSKNAFDCAMKGYELLLKKNIIKKSTVLTSVDYSKPSTEKRLYVLNITDGKLLYHSLAAHGRNSGLLYANNFSNKPASLKTSLGFFITANTYVGNNGYSLKLQGCEKGINDKAMERAIVMHGADYVNENFIAQNGYLGRSHGCPAIPDNISKKLIDDIKGGSCVFLYYPLKQYMNRSKILNNPA